ncbi:hypothetical protein K1719_018327 [Acacia pycnantha]|nr:hypothetical protein K1719_018327 [Acacia pycnantha]
MCRFVPSSSNGLVCLQLNESKSLCVWNPAIREVFHVARPLSSDRRGLSSIGFGFSPIVNDYKIVRLFYSIDSRVAHKVEVFALSTRLWKKVEVGKLECVIPPVHYYGLSFNGAIFWFSFNLEVGKNQYGVVSFDVATEVFTLIPFPSSACKSNCYKLATYENKLAMLSSNKIVNMESSSVDLWVMDKCIDGSKETCIWTKIYTSNPYPCFLFPQTIWINEIVCKVKEMGTSIRGRKVVLENDDEARLVFCNLHTNEFKEFGKCSFTTPIWNYEESVISVDLAEMGLGQNGIGGSTQNYGPVAPRRSLRLKKRDC